ncbi:uncharacterized protein LOC127737548 isoform X1 [Mytilus californianus]|uniref:uncharacterized protein LOC127737548 isoform X1 n=2 Tax=Mytilus californianus TaxID=6549 RepID=UPI002245C5C4|nr:uncharacterized protein LOC127737548 isoform X1 [Mytilus californianus]
MDKTKQQDVTERSDNCVTILQLLLLVLNILLIVAIFAVSVSWTALRNGPIKDMIPAPNVDRSLCVKTDQTKQCDRIKPEKYIADEIDKNMRKLQMQYMAEKLNYANVVCRKTAPSVYLFRGINKSAEPSGSIRWNQNTEINKTGNSSLSYDPTNGTFTIMKDRMYFIYSQITEMAENRMHNGTALQIFLLGSNGKSQPILESDSAQCIMISAAGKRAHYVGSAYSLKEGDVLYAVHSHPQHIVNSHDTFMGIRELW